MAKGKEARVRVILDCTGCGRRTSIYRYITQKNRHNTPSQLEFREFCPYFFFFEQKQDPTIFFRDFVIVIGIN